MRFIYFLLLLLSLSSCISHNAKDVEDVSVSEKNTLEIKYATGFSVDESHDDFTKVIINSNQSQFSFTDSIFLPHNKDFVAGERKVVKANYKSLALQSSTYLAYLKILNKIDLVKGISGLQYVNSPKYISELEKNSTIEISIDGGIQMETLHSIDPDLFLIFPFELANQSIYEENGIQTLLISEYLEETPMARLEWIKLFGLLFKESELANEYFDNIENEYLNHVTYEDTMKKIFFNLPHKDNWNMPSANSITANLIRDAGFNYIYSEGTHDNFVKSNEQVWSDAMTCEYWIIIASRPADFSLADLTAEAKIYAKFPAVKNNKVIFCNTATTEYFTSGVVEPDIMLKDLLFAKGELESHVPKYFTLLK
jgi:iron complex transport system substrate-binding protein